MNLTGKEISHYRILGEIGRGGMAVVYRAYQPSLNRYVAIKVLPPQLSFDQQFVERFQREARAAAGLRHPNIVVIHDVGQQEGIYYIVMEHLEGRTLRQIVEQEGPLPPARAAYILQQVAAALDYAHQRGFVHRDVKPANIFVGEGDRVTLTDFGIAKAAAEAEQLTRTGMLMGTPEYMSPEQAEGGSVDHRTDIYALGVLLYQMLVGRVPFRGTTPHATLHAVIYEPPTPPRQINPSISSNVEAVILKSIAKQPDQRFQSGAELLSALGAVLARQRQPQWIPPPPLGPEPGKSVPPRPPQRRSPVVWIVAAMAIVLLLMLAVLTILLLGGGSQDGTPLPSTTEAVAVITPTSGTKTETPVSEQTVSPEPLATATSSATVTAEVSTDTPAPPTDTSEPPTDTPEPSTDTPTPTATPSPLPTTPPPPPCAFPAQGLFASLWQTYRAQLGCPLHQDPRPLQDAEQAFDHGHMFWRQDNDYAYVVYESGGLAGSYQAFVDLWSEGDPDFSCIASPPPGKVQPKRGFGAVWCALGGPSAAIGWGLAEEAGFGPGYGDPIVQDFERGFILRDSDGRTSGQAYVFMRDSLKFVRVPY